MGGIAFRLETPQGTAPILGMCPLVAMQKATGSETLTRW
jgi:hypothetical protein